MQCIVLHNAPKPMPIGTYKLRGGGGDDQCLGVVLIGGSVSFFLMGIVFIIIGAVKDLLGLCIAGGIIMSITVGTCICGVYLSKN